MENLRTQALENAAASSAMEGLPLSLADLETVEKILNGELSLAAYFGQLKQRYEDS